MNSEERDWLIEVKSDIKYMRAWTETHTKEDSDRHHDNLKKFDKIDENENWQNKLLYGAIGVVVFVEFLSKFIK